MHILFNPRVRASRNFYLHMYRPRAAVTSEGREGGGACVRRPPNAENTSQMHPT